jgi:hypothetical protein
VTRPNRSRACALAIGRFQPGEYVKTTPWFSPTAKRQDSRGQRLMVQGTSGVTAGDVATMGLPLIIVARGAVFALVSGIDGFFR